MMTATKIGYVVESELTDPHGRFTRDDVHVFVASYRVESSDLRAATAAAMLHANRDDVRVVHMSPVAVS